MTNAIKSQKVLKKKKITDDRMPYMKGRLLRMYNNHSISMVVMY